MWEETALLSYPLAPFKGVVFLMFSSLWLTAGTGREYRVFPQIPTITHSRLFWQPGNKSENLVLCLRLGPAQLCTQRCNIVACCGWVRHFEEPQGEWPLRRPNWWQAGHTCRTRWGFLRFFGKHRMLPWIIPFVSLEDKWQQDGGNYNKILLSSLLLRLHIQGI